MKPSGYGLDLVQKRCNRPPIPLHYWTLSKPPPSPSAISQWISGNMYFHSSFYPISILLHSHLFSEKKIHKADARERERERERERGREREERGGGLKKRLNEEKRHKLSESVEQKHIMMWMTTGQIRRSAGNMGTHGAKEDVHESVFRWSEKGRHTPQHTRSGRL